MLLFLLKHCEFLIWLFYKFVKKLLSTQLYLFAICAAAVGSKYRILGV